MFSTVKYTDDTSDSQKEKLEWKIRRGTEGYNMPRIHWILCHLYFAFFPQLKSDLHGKRFSDMDELRTESDLKKHGLVISMESWFN